jgi:hypothetical protein
VTCTPKIVGSRAGYFDRLFGAGEFAWKMRCYQHDTGWCSQGTMTWQNALDAVIDHQEEYVNE